MNIRFTLVAEGSTDIALLPILRWAIRNDPRIREIEAQFASPNFLPPPRKGLAAKIRRALELFPTDLLFVHRDADREPTDARRGEIQQAVESIANLPLAVPVVPVRETEAWLLIDESAIRSAAGNPRGSMSLERLPRLTGIERVADPKILLHETLRTACGLHGRKLAKFKVHARAILVAERITDFKPLRALSAFAEFENILHQALDRLAEIHDPR